MHEPLTRQLGPVEIAPHHAVAADQQLARHHPIEVLRVPGDHDTILLEPNATTLVRTLGDALDRAEEMPRLL